jgi:Cysteine-rich secretory protein family
MTNQTHLVTKHFPIVVAIALGITIANIALENQAIAATKTPPTPMSKLAQSSITQSSISEEILNAHNQYRLEVDVPFLIWSEALASDAQDWANHLAALGGQTLEHAENTGQGENLWMGTSGFFSPTEMVSSWGEEQQYFQGGTFPDVSSTGNWFDVGHYTQLVWRKTTEVGCGIATAGGNDIFVCRYNPPGNFMGEPVY